MPRPKKESAGEPKKRSRTGCWPCKSRKIKCGEEKPVCTNCVKNSETCDYSIRLNWGGRTRKDAEGGFVNAGSMTFVTSTPSTQQASGGGGGHEHVFSAQHISAPPRERPAASSTNTVSPGSAGTTLPGWDSRHADQQQSWHHDFKLYQGTAGGSSKAPRAPPAPAAVMYDRSPPAQDPTRDEFRWSPQHSAKRVKLSPTGASHTQSQSVFAIPPLPLPSPSEGLGLNSHGPRSIGSIVNTPVTPGSSVTSNSPFTGHAVLTVQDPPDLRRLSVKSLLSDPSEDSERSRRGRTDGYYSRTYGYDHGFPDLDIPHNDDMNVVLPRSPDLRRASAAVSDGGSDSSGEGEGDGRHMAFEPGGYYAQPVPVKIPRFLEPLPEELLNNQMNLLYFHHFINHTGRILVPHDCPENPYRTVLPQMAVRNTHLLHLVLTFSASHRARLLDHPEPANRIAEWMSDVLPALRQALAPQNVQSPGAADHGDPSSLAPLATAIMFASLEIISPNTFAVPISWQDHLKVARNMIVAKGGLHHLAQKADGARDKAIFFLSRWFAYLDVVGALSGSKQDEPLFGAYLEDGGGLWLVNRNDDEIYQIDCFFGFSGRCLALLAQVAEVATQCDRERIDPITNQIKSGWMPSDDARQLAEDLRRRLSASATTVYRGCMHVPGASPSLDIDNSDQDADEIYATNEAFHWAGQIHLSRRVLGLSSINDEVQEGVRNIVQSLLKIRRGSTAESCLLMPLFTGGCEALTEDDRALFMDRMKAVEGWGMPHIGRAREIMQTVWDTGRPWETLVNGEFIG